MNESDKAVLREVAEQAAKEAVRGMLVQLGIDPDKPIEAQRDFQHLRDWRKAVETIRAIGLKTIVGIIITGALGALWVGFRQKLGG